MSFQLISFVQISALQHKRDLNKNDVKFYYLFEVDDGRFNSALS